MTGFYLTAATEAFRVAASNLVHIPAKTRDILHPDPDTPEQLDTPTDTPGAKLLSMELNGPQQT